MSDNEKITPMDFAVNASHDTRLRVHIVSNPENSHPFVVEVIYETGPSVLDDLEKAGLLGAIVKDRTALDISPAPDNTPNVRRRRLSRMYKMTDRDVFVGAEHNRFSGNTTVRWHSRSRDVQSELIERLQNPEFLTGDGRGTKGTKITFWFRKPQKGSDSFSRILEPDDWEMVRKNYDGTAEKKLDDLVHFTTDKSKGRIVLLTGIPGTGKTHFIQTLAKEWRPWCKTHYVLSPMAFMSEESAVLDLISSVTDEDDLDEDRTTKPEWHLVVMEDTGLFLGTDASTLSTGFSSFLNLSDGLLGQGLNVMFLLTTNERVEKAHEAVLRPGRLHAHIRLDRLSPDECESWAERNALPTPLRAWPSEGMTLAELYGFASGEIRSGVDGGITGGSRIGFGPGGR